MLPMKNKCRQLITQAYERFGAIHGVIHSAGIVGEQSKRTIPEMDYIEYEKQFRPKVHGVYVLERVLQGRELDFCILQSSLSSVLGGLAYSAYSGANIFMDAFAHKHNQTSCVPWISVNWDAWRFEGERESSTAMGATLAKLAITPEEGIEAFQRVLSLDSLTQIVVSTGDLHTRIDQWIKLIPLQDTKNPTKVSAFSDYRNPNLQNTYVAPKNELAQTIADVWRGVLGIDQLGIYDNFFNLGGHSLMALQVLSRLRRAFQVDVSVRLFFEALTVAGQAEIIEKAKSQAEQAEHEEMAHLLAELEGLPDEEAQRLLANGRE